jgi:urea transport system ATP-binding protein
MVNPLSGSRVSVQQGAPLLEVREVVKRFGGLEALRGVNLTLGAGELRCLIGPNGCGKTTLFNVITGAFAPTAGRVLFRGDDITGLAAHHVGRRGIARKFQVPGIYPTLSVAENLEIPLLNRRGMAGPLAMLRAGSEGAVRMRALLERFDLGRAAHRLAGELAHGQKQWLEIAMLVAADAQLLLLDEPTAGMSAAETSATVELIRRVQHEHGIAVLVIEHDMSFVRQLGCPVSVMIRGAVRFEGSYEDVQAHPEVREAYLGQAAAA